MEKAQLSKTYSGACNRMHEAITKLYEAVHTNAGEPVVGVEYVIDRVSECRRVVLMEADLMREVVREYDEESNSKRKEEE